MRKIEANDEDLQALGVILDVACKAAGLSIAESAVVWKHKIEGSEEIKEEKPDKKKLKGV